MKQINIKYKPFFWLKFTRSIKGKHPESWSEVSPQQLIAIARSYQGGISVSEFISVLTGIPRRIIRKLDDYQHYKLLELVNFINDHKPYGSFILKSFQIGDIEFVSPKPLLKDFTFGQFIFADSYFANFRATQKPEELHRFLAALYIPSGKKFKAGLIDTNYRLIEQLDYAVKEAIVLNYMLVKLWLSACYPLILLQPEPEDFENEKNQTNTSKHDPMGWVKILDNLVGDDISNQSKYTRLPLHNVFRYMTTKIKENLKKK